MGDENKIKDLGATVQAIQRGEKVDIEKVTQLLELYGDVPIYNADGRVTNTFVSPISAEVLNRAYRAQTGKDHDKYIANQPKMVQIKLQYRENGEKQGLPPEYYQELELISQKLQLQRQLDAEEQNVIKDPDKIKKLRQEREAIEGKIISADSKRIVSGEQTVPNNEDKNTKHANRNEANYDQMLARRAEIKLALDEALASVAKDNNEIAELRKELVELEAAILAAEGIEEVGAEEAEHEKTDVVENQTQDLSQDETENEAQKAQEAGLKQAYYETMLNFYATREANANILKNTPDSFVNSSEEYLREIKAEDAMYRARDEYLKLGKTDPYAAEREALNKQAKKNEKQNRELLERKTREYRELELELARLQKARAEKEEEIANAIKDGATQAMIDELKADLNELDYKIKDTKQALAKVKENLSQAMDVLELRRHRRRELDLESREYAAQSAKEQANIRYAEDKAAKGRNDFEQAKKVSTSSIKLEVERNEQRYEKIKKELKELKEKEPDNFERRLALLEQLDDASQQLKASREVQRDVELGIEPDTDEAVRQAESQYKSKEERREDFEQAAEELAEAAQAQEKAEGQVAVEDPTLSEKEKEKVVLTGAVVGAVVLGDADDTLSEDIGQAAMGAFVAETCVIPGLEKQVEDPNDPNAAARYVALVESKEAELAAQQIEKRTIDEIE